MINLLPPASKNGILYARRNSLLRKWAISLLLGIICIAVGVGVGVGQLYLQKSIQAYTAQTELGRKNLKTQDLEGTQKKVQDISSSLKLVTQVLQKEILFSKLLKQIGSALPNGSVLTNLSINKVQGGLEMQAAATDYQTATQVQLNLQDPKNKIFEKADILNIQCDAKTSASDPVKSQYPCTVQIKALFAKNNSFTLISPTPGSKP